VTRGPLEANRLIDPGPGHGIQLFFETNFRESQRWSFETTVQQPLQVSERDVFEHRVSYPFGVGHRPVGITPISRADIHVGNFAGGLRGHAASGTS
jgi:hypothetical protein